jgi:hypothetical protein
MYIPETTRPGPNGTVYRCVLLRQSSREGGTGKNRTRANLSHGPAQAVEAIRLALHPKDDLALLGPFQHAPMHAGRSVGAGWVLSERARRRGIEAAVGTARAGKVARWPVMARVIAQGARLSAVRLAQTPAACAVWHITRGGDETHLYDNLPGLAETQDPMARRWFTTRRGDRKPTLFLSAVTSSDLEGQGTALAAVGSNRDGTAGKKHGGRGRLCDEEGTPGSGDVVAGNPPDRRTLAAQITQGARRVGCERVPCVGDRGLLKSRPIEARARAGLHSLPALPTPQGERWLKATGLQLARFPAQGGEVEHAGTRDIRRRHPLRAEEMAAVRGDTPRRMEQWGAQNTAYLAAHPRAQAAGARRACHPTLARLHIDAGLTGEIHERTFCLRGQGEAHREAAQRDGCDVRKTDRPRTVAGTAVGHER